jgi:hypothetical protein
MPYGLAIEWGGRSDGRGGTLPDNIGHRMGKRHHMSDIVHDRAHVVAGGFPPGSSAGHDHDFARLRLLTLLAERQIPASVANDFDMEKWLPVCRRPLPECRAVQPTEIVARGRRP